MGQQHDRRAGAVGVDRARVAADEVEHALELVLGLMKDPGAGPAVRTAEDALVSMANANAIQFGRHRSDCLGPADLDELVATAIIRWSGALLQPTASNCGPLDSCAMACCAGHAT